MTVSNPNMYYSENLPVRSYGTEMLFTIIKIILSSSHSISIFFTNYFLRYVEGSLAYYSLEPESHFFSVVRKEKSESKSGESC